MTVSDKQDLEECATSQPALQETLKEVFQGESNWYSIVIQIHTHKKTECQ